MSLYDLPAEGQTEPGSRGLGRIKTATGRRVARARPDRCRKDRRRASTTKPRPSSGNRRWVVRYGDALGRRAGFRGVLQQVDHHLLELADIQVGGSCGQWAFDPKGRGAFQTCEEIGPGHRCQARSRKFREAGIAVDERCQVGRAVTYGGEDALQLRMGEVLRQQASGVT